MKTPRSQKRKGAARDAKQPAADLPIAPQSKSEKTDEPKGAAEQSRKEGRDPRLDDISDEGCAPRSAEREWPLPIVSGSTNPEADDLEDIASKESFPASDPPATY
jgi:hypothetical protein